MRMVSYPRGVYVSTHRKVARFSSYVRSARSLVFTSVVYHLVCTMHVLLSSRFFTPPAPLLSQRHSAYYSGQTSGHSKNRPRRLQLLRLLFEHDVIATI